MANVIETIEGIAGDLWYHYDIARDVLYLRLTSERMTASLAEETPDGFLLLRAEADDRVIGLTIVNWWKRFGAGELPDSLREIQSRIEPWGEKLAA